MSDFSTSKISTSAMAKLMEVPTQQLFTTLKDYGWIKKIDDGWALSSKGEFEGGEYVTSKQYGRYIVWPEKLTEHPLLQALEDNLHLSATVLGRSVGISAREVNRLIAELGWIKHSFQGWELTALGESHGGIQLDNEISGSFYVVWPQAITADPVLSRQLALGTQIGVGADLAEDLFANQDSYKSVDGHTHDNKSLLQICHWLYMAGLAHSCQRQLPTVETLVADFYLPAHQLYIEYWDDDGKKLASRLRRKEIYQQLELSVIDIERRDLLSLDEVLTREFRKRGIRVY